MDLSKRFLFTEALARDYLCARHWPKGGISGQ
jgi:hypothetical protein